MHLFIGCPSLPFTGTQNKLLLQLFPSGVQVSPSAAPPVVSSVAPFVELPLAELPVKLPGIDPNSFSKYVEDVLKHK